jgi:hypothetical protein
MVSVLMLWLPIVVSAVVVFVASSIMHIVLSYHSNDFDRLSQEDEVMAALRPFDIPPADYAVPHGGSTAAMKKPEFVAKMKAGPVLVMTVFPAGPRPMGGNLVLWFLYSLVVGVFAAYIAGQALPAGASYAAVFRFAACTAFTSYSLALLQGSIWWGRRWSTTLKSMFDGLVYALLTGATFGWLWPH